MIKKWLPSKIFYKVNTTFSSKVGSLQLWQQKSIFSMHYKSSQKNAKFCSTFSASEMSKSFRFMEHFWLVFEWWSIFISQTKVFSLFPPALYGWVPTAVWHKNTAVEIMWWEISGIQFPYSSTHYAFFSCVYGTS